MLGPRRGSLLSYWNDILFPETATEKVKASGWGMVLAPSSLFGTLTQVAPFLSTSMGNEWVATLIPVAPGPIRQHSFLVCCDPASKQEVLVLLRPCSWGRRRWDRGTPGATSCLSLPLHPRSYLLSVTAFELQTHR